MQLLFVGKLNAQEFILSDGFEDCFPGQRLYWAGGGDDLSWASPANWQGNAIPAAGQSISIPIFISQNIVYASSLGTRSIRCLDSKRALVVTGGNLEILKAGRVNSSVTVTDGSITVTGRLQATIQ